MIRNIVRDPLFLGRKSTEATLEDVCVLDDLMDTLRANSDRCVGMAANMIGVSKRIIAFFHGPLIMGMLNPEITAKSDPYPTQEGCLSLDGVRNTVRFRRITVAWQDRNGKRMQSTFEGWTAQIIQHEIDHCSGILI